MPDLNRTTVYLEPTLHRALKVKAAVTDQSLSALVNDAIRQSLRGHTRSRARRLSREDAIDLETFRKRRHEKGRPFDEFLRSLRGSLKSRKGEPSALDILLAERRRERQL